MNQKPEATKPKGALTQAHYQIVSALLDKGLAPNDLEEPIFSDYVSPTGANGLRAYLAKQVRGNPQEYRTPFYKGLTPHEVAVKFFRPIQDSLADSYGWIWEVENAQIKKCGAMSYQLPVADRVKDIVPYFTDIKVKSEPISDEAVSRVLKELAPIKGIRLRTDGHTLEEMKKSTNSGLPYFTKRRRVVYDTYVGLYFDENKRNTGRYIKWSGPKVPISKWRYSGDPEERTLTKQRIHGTYSVNLNMLDQMSFDASSRELLMIVDNYDDGVSKGILPPMKDFKAAAVLGWRGQENGPLDILARNFPKQRTIFMMPMWLNCEELKVYQPLIAAIQGMKDAPFPGWIGDEAVSERITKLMDTKGKDDLLICTDFSRFDQHFNSDMQDCAKKILRGVLATNDTWTEVKKVPVRHLGSMESHRKSYPLEYSIEQTIVHDRSQEWLDEIFPLKFRIPLMITDRILINALHGMGSGSGGTSGDETLTHRALQHEAAADNGQELNKYSVCHGDDGVISFPHITLEQVLKAYTKHGQEMNPDKQSVSKDSCTFLRKVYHTDYRIKGKCVGVYPIARAIGHLCEQERYYDPDKWGKEMQIMRSLSIIENCKYHPYFYEFIDFCIAGDKYRLGLDIPDFLDKIEEWAKKAVAAIPDMFNWNKRMQMGEGQSDDFAKAARGIAEWEVVKYLRLTAKQEASENR